MATTRFWKINSNLAHVIEYVGNTEKTVEKNEKSEDDLNKVLHYATNPVKTEVEEKLYVTGVNCNHETAYEEMQITKEQWQKTDGTLAWHGYMSFAPGEVTPEQAHAIGVEFAEKNFPGFQVVVATHLNTGVLHNHFVVNSISFLDGHRVHDEATWFKFRKLVDEILKNHQLSVIKKPRRTKEPTLIDNKIADYYGRVDAPLIKAAVDKALAVSTNMLQFKKELSKAGYNYNLSPNRKYWTVSPKGCRSFRLYHLGNDYTNVAITERLVENQKKIIKPVRVMATRITFKKFTGKRSMIVGLYWHYMYVLGKIKRNPENTDYIPHRVRRDVAKLTAMSEEVRWLEANNLNEASELMAYMDNVKNEMSKLEAERTALRNESRRKGSDAETIRAKTAEISRELAKKRKELRMGDNVLKRSVTISENIDALEEQIEQERRNDDERGSRSSDPISRRDI